MKRFKFTDSGKNKRTEWGCHRISIIMSCFVVFGSMTVLADETGQRSTVDGETVALNGARKPMIGAYYYPWYSSDGRHWNEGYVRGKLNSPQKPLLGEYDSRDEAVINQQVRWAKEAGVDFFCVSYWGEDTFGDKAIKNHFVHAEEVQNFKFAILYETIADKLLLRFREDGQIYLEEGNEAETVFFESIDYLAKTYFHHPSYMRIDGKPVIVLYVSHLFIGDHVASFQRLRDKMQEKHGFDLYIIGDDVDPIRRPRPDRIAMYDAITPYIQYCHAIQTLSDTRLGYADDVWFLQSARMKNERFKAIADEFGVNFVPTAVPSFNDRGVRLDVNHYVLPHKRNASDPRPYSLFEDSLQLASEFMNEDAPIMMVTSWNEWHEDSQIEPVQGWASTLPENLTCGFEMEPYGTDLLEILKQFKMNYSGKPAVQAKAPLQISELCLAYDGQENASYIELFNAGDKPVNVGGMRLCLRSRHDTLERDHHYVRLEGLIPAGGTYLIATPSAQKPLKEHNAIEGDLIIKSETFAQISLDNGQIAVRDQKGRILDAFSWTAGSSFDGDYVEKENLKLHAALGPNQALVRRINDRDQNNSALDFEVGMRSPKRATP